MSKAEYIKAINQLLDKCCEEKVLYYIMRFLEKIV